MQWAVLSCWTMIPGDFPYSYAVYSWWLRLLETCHLTVYFLSQYSIFGGRHLEIDDRNRGNRRWYATFDPGELWVYLPTPKKGLTGQSLQLQVSSSFFSLLNLCITHVHTCAFCSLVRVFVRCICFFSLGVWFDWFFLQSPFLFWGGRALHSYYIVVKGVGCPWSGPWAAIGKARGP